MEAENSDLLGSGQAEMWQLIFDFSNSMALKCAADLGIADIIHSHGHPLSLSQLASGINSPNLNDQQMSYLARMMRFLVNKNIFTCHQSSDSSGEILFGLNEKSKWLLRDSEFNFVPLMRLNLSLLEPWKFISQSIKEGGTPFNKAYGCEFWDYASNHPEISRIFDEAMVATTKIIMKAVLLGYKNGFDNVSTLVDVGGGIGQSLSEIVKAYPHIKGINFDLPHVVSNAPAYDGITHVAGDMFESIPPAGAIFIKTVLHNWGDEYCIKILKNCRRAIPDENGKIILVEIVLQEDGKGDKFGDVKLNFDLLMLAHHKGGKQRTELEWKILLEEGGFPRYKITKIESLFSIIEAFPN